MNARILRKWSIHTKNLMSCSVCSFVVVVLLLLVTCAPSLILAKLNFRSDASFAANPPHMPKNIIKEATLSATASTSPLYTSLLSSSLPNRHQRLASTSASEEVVNTPNTNIELLPGYYKNLNSDDINQMPQVSGHLSTSIRNRNSYNEGSNFGIGSGGLMPFPFSSSSSSSSRSSSSTIRHRNTGITQQQHPFYSTRNDDSSNDDLNYMPQQRGWPKQYTPSPTLDIRNDEDIYNNIDAGDNAEKVAVQKILYIRNENSPQQVPPHTTIKRNIQMHQMQYHNHRKRLATISSAAPLTVLSPHKMMQHMQPELIHHNKNNFNVKNDEMKSFISTTQPQKQNKSVPEEKNQHLTTTNSNINKIKSSGLPLRFIIESYEVPASLPLAKGLTEQQHRMLIHEQHLRQLRTKQQQTARSRRDSFRGIYKKDLLLNTTAPLLPLSPTLLPSAHHNHNDSENLNQQHQPRLRKHSRRYCSARDPAQLAFEAPTVFEGKIVSMTPDRRQNFSATVEVREVFKQQIDYRLQKYLRLQFAFRNNSGECDIYREQLRPRGLVRGDTIEPGRIYLLFVQQIDIGNFTILGQPIRKTKRVVDAVRSAVKGNYAQLASIKSISASNRTVENGQELRIVCRVTGRPPPKVTWFKDHRSINRNRKLYQFSHFKKRSELIIRSFNTSDAGRYECRAKNKVNRNIERRAIVIKAYPVQRFDPNPRGTGNNCPDDASEFCFNGGTCKFFSEIGSYSCICPEGFIGERCDRKEVNNMPPSTYSNEHECGENKYLGSYYC